jgi:hypothetical protein
MRANASCLLRSNVNYRWVGEGGSPAAARVHNVDFAALWLARSTFGTYTEHFVDFTYALRARST